MPVGDPSNAAEALLKRSVSIAGHRTSVSMENIFWDGLKQIAAARGVSVARLISDIDTGRTTNLSSAIRVFVLSHYMKD